MRNLITFLKKTMLSFIVLFFLAQDSYSAYYHYRPHHHHHHHRWHYYHDTVVIRENPWGDFTTGVLVGSAIASHNNSRQQQDEKQAKNVEKSENTPKPSFLAEAAEDFTNDPNSTYAEIESHFLDIIKDPKVYRQNPVYSHIGGLVDFYSIDPDKLIDLNARLFKAYQVPMAYVIRMYISDMTVDANHVKRGANSGFQPIQKDGYFYFDMLFQGKKRLIKAKYNASTFPYFPFYVVGGSGKRLVGLFLPVSAPSIFLKNPKDVVNIIKDLQNYLQEDIDNKKENKK